MSLGRAAFPGNVAGRAAPRDVAAGGAASGGARRTIGFAQKSPTLPWTPLLVIAPKALIGGTWKTADVV